MNNRFYSKLKFMKYLYIVLFVFVCIYLMYFSYFESRDISSNSYNRRLRSDDSSIIRGSILDRNGETLVKSSKYKNSVKRKYLYGKYFAQIIGYSSKTLGSSGIEARFNKELMNSNNTIEALKSKANGYYIEGNNIKLTLDSVLQEYAANQLGNKKGSIVVLNPKTGEILAMVSKPDYNPSNIQENWEDLIADKDSPLLNRAAEGLYPPGSIFKLIPAAAAIKENMENMSIDCIGKVNIDGYEIKDSDEKSHGLISLHDAFKLSCNSYFINLGLKLGINNMLDMATKFRFNKPIDSDIKTVQSSFPKHTDSKNIAQQSIGQGEVLITPLHAALLAAAIANDGIMMEPYSVSSIAASNGSIIKAYKPKQLGEVMDRETAEILTAMMIDVVKSGTGTRAKVSNNTVAGKTGTAENPTGKPHAWFIGFAPAENPRIAIAVLVENGGSGGGNAAPIASKVLRKALNLYK